MVLSQSIDGPNTVDTTGRIIEIARPGESNQGKSCHQKYDSSKQAYDESIISLGCSGNNIVVCNRERDQDPHWDFAKNCDANEELGLEQRTCINGACIKWAGPARRATPFFG